jgi:glucose-1-phosphate thymidylyltransferase
VTKKGIILAGGSGTRLYPMTQVVCKQLIPVYDKPMIYYPLSVLMLAGIQEVLIITTPEDRMRFEALLGSGRQWGMSFQYAVQERPEGLAQAFIIGEEFLAGESGALILGDNIFFGQGLQNILKDAATRTQGATIFGYHVKNPSSFGVAEFDEKGVVIGLEEKPTKPKSEYAVTGLYFYDSRVSAFAKALKPSPRGELEITDLNRCYLEAGDLHFSTLGRGIAWLDTGTPDGMLQAGNFIATVQSLQGLRVACPEEIAFNSGWIDSEQIKSLASPLRKTEYGEYLLRLAKR